MSNLFQQHREFVGKRIRMARVLSNKSHDTLAREIGTSRQHLIKLEKGQHMPRPEMLTAIADATGKPESYFTSADDDEEAASMPASAEAMFLAAVKLAMRDAFAELRAHDNADLARTVQL